MRKRRRNVVQGASLAFRLSLYGVLIALALVASSFAAPHEWPLALEWNVSTTPGTDWDVFRLAVYDLLTGANPYARSGPAVMRFYNPVWTLIPLIPFALLPRYTGFLLWNTTALALLAAICRKFGYRVWEFSLLVLSAPVMYAFLFGNPDMLVWVGLLMPTPVALLFFSMKPQSSIGLILFHLVETFREKGARGLALALLPVSLLALVSLLLYGLPTLSPLRQNLWPWSLLPGLILLGVSLWRRKWRGAAASGPLVAPYAATQAFLAVLWSFRGWSLALAVLLSWSIPLWVW